MAKQRQTNSIVSAIRAATAALRVEGIPNPTEEQLRQIHEAKVQAADVIENSNFVTMAENVDESIELQHQIEEQRENEQAALDEANENENGVLPPAEPQ